MTDDKNPADREDPAALTTLHVRRAREGDRESLGWLVERLSPLVRVSVEYWLPRSMRRLYDPDDIVSDAWVATLPRLEGLSERGGRYTPVLVKFLTTTARQTIQNLVRKHAQNKPAVLSADDMPLDALPEDVDGVVTQAAKRELRNAVRESLDGLGEADRTLLALRGLEQRSYDEIAQLMSVEKASSLRVRYLRALAKLRRRLPGGVFDELPED